MFYPLTRIRKIPLWVSDFINIFSIVLFSFPLIITVISKCRSAGPTNSGSPTELFPITPKINQENLPDIYHIILDGYANANTLVQIYNFDNHEFIDYLKSKGFFILEHSKSNYTFTQLSIPSTMMMDYAKIEESDEKPKQAQINTLNKLENKVKAYVMSRGYKYDDLNVSTGSSVLNEASEEFYFMVLNLTIAKAFLTRLSLFPNIIRNTVLNRFEALKKSTELPGPKFVFASIRSPHPPFVFTQNGDHYNQFLHSTAANIWKSGWDDYEGYLNQLIYISKLTQESVEYILTHSKKAPVILIHSDHGPHFTVPLNEAMENAQSNFAAIYSPDGQRLFYEGITPVNYFKVIFNHYFNAGLTLSKDESFYSKEDNPFSIKKWVPNP
ncbi:MAG: hypothetical protein PHW04_02910 [Candidatus Wallbacteria bacterium]|nr:hypothetical protein [Candidatus Wallbacteria bacterium]